MTMVTTVKFRGEDVDVVIDEYEVEYDTNCCIVEWHFADVLPVDHDALNVTDAEEDEIIEAIHKFMVDRR